MGIVDAVRGWFGTAGDGQEQEPPRAADPRAYDRLDDGAQFTAAAAERLEYANPDVGPPLAVFSHEIGGEVEFGGAESPKSLVHVGEWREVASRDAYWDDVRTVVAHDAEGFHYSIEARSEENGDTQAVYWNGPHEDLDAAKEAASQALAQTLAAWDRFAGTEEPDHGLDDEAQEWDDRGIAALEWAQVARERAGEGLER